MSLKKFLDLFKEYSKEVKVLLHGSRIRIESEDHTFCPVTFVCYKVTGKRWSVSYPSGAGHDLKLKPCTLNEIVNAADLMANCHIRRQFAACVNSKREGGQ